ncbi:Hypothetical predicted protein [Lecanosticta acicola]|uniref:Nuclear distribution protein RO10 n=1 Tax=Lecanosticta acicola TaxID=111012 RepID=A0AAI9ECA5_9PEZI|nr:Hypothetical predicted protein [Lecanosticta acicola]
MVVTSDTAADTLAMLEERLARIDFLVSGSGTEAAQSPGNASKRLRALERTLQTLAAKSRPITDLLQLQRQYPELFSPSSAHPAPSTLPPAALAQLVLAHEQMYKKAASQLSILNENKDVHDPSQLTKLIAMRSRTGKLEAKQKEQAKEFAELRARSAKIVEQWYESGVLDMGEKWADWEERLRDCEILVRRNEAAKKREEGML